MERGKTTLIGLDGFNSGAYEYLAARGAIPNLVRIVSSGSRGTLLSTRPPYTGPAWVSMTTGVNPGHHGIFGFTRRRPGGYDHEVLTASRVGAPRIWDYAAAAGRDSLIFNVPFTFPAGAAPGRLVSGMLTPSLEADFAAPAPLAEKIRRRHPGYIFDFAIDPERDFVGDRALKAIGSELECKRNLLEELLASADPEFLMAVFVTPDRIQHLWGKAVLGEAPFPAGVEEGVLRLFAALDAAVGGLAGRMGEKDTLLIASDHGFAGLRSTFYLNNWLSAEGFLAWKGGGKKVSKLLGAFNRTACKRLVPRKLVERVRRRAGEDLVDWSRTRAYASPGMEEGCYLNQAGREPEGNVLPGEDRERTLAEIRSGLSALPGPIFRGVLPREEVYRGEFLDRAPDLLLDFARSGWNMSSSCVGASLWRDWEKYPFGVHHPHGFWAGRGPGWPAVRRDADILDIAPTV
ncbi:MAG TPA: alkaline phosphatase family protein, partial [bacterium]|nr:alkaline phosphatase family protein [bacterium]